MPCGSSMSRGWPLSLAANFGRFPLDPEKMKNRAGFNVVVAMDVHQTHNSHSFAPHRYVIKPHSLAIPCCLLEWWSNGEVNPDDVTWQTLHAKKRDVFYSVITCDTSFANIWNLFSFLLLLAMTCYDLLWLAMSCCFCSEDWRPICIDWGVWW